MIFTLYYMYATVVQWWRLGSLKNKINGTLNSHNALLICTGNSICDSKRQRCLENLLFHNEDRIGCTVVPKQKLSLSQWVSFPNDMKSFPIFISDIRPRVKSPFIYVLVQAVLENYTKHNSETIQVENFGELVAWRASEIFEVILKTDIENLTKLVHCFSQNCVDINHDLKLLKIETVDVEGNTTRIKYDKTYLLEQKLKYSYAPVHWKKFSSEIKQLYSKIHDAINPKIKIENGCPKSEPNKKVPVSEVKPIKKESKKVSEDKNTLEVGSSDHRRHKKSSEDRQKKREDHVKSKTHKTEVTGKPDKSKSTLNEQEIKSDEVNKMGKDFKDADQASSSVKVISQDITSQKPTNDSIDEPKIEENGLLPLKSPAKDVLNITSSNGQLPIEACVDVPNKILTTDHNDLTKSPKLQQSKESTSTASKPQSSKESKCLIANVLSKTRESCRIKDRKDRKSEEKSKSRDSSKEGEETTPKVKEKNKSKDKEKDKYKSKDIKNKEESKKEKVGKDKETEKKELKSRDRSKENGETSQKGKEKEKTDVKIKDDDKKDLKPKEKIKEKEVSKKSKEADKKSKEVDKKDSKSRDKSKENEGETVKLEEKKEEKRRFLIKLGCKDKSTKPKCTNEATTSETKHESHSSDKIKTSTSQENICKASSTCCSLDKESADGDQSKPPNILVYADSFVAKENVKCVLQTMINKEKYTIYDLPVNTQNVSWNASTTLIVICGSVPPNLTSHLLQYLVSGGKLLCLCSDLLYSVLQTFTTAEVREHELVRFSYGEWKRVKMMHHIFCYQASPAKKQFSRDSDNSNQSSNGSSPIAPRTPSAVEIQHNGKNFTIQVQVLGTEETWQTPSLLLATVRNTKGKAIFSQVHLEIDPTQYEDDENKYEALKDSNQARLEIFKDILLNYLNIDCASVQEPLYSPAYFLGRHDLKLEMLSTCDNIQNNVLNTEKLDLVFCGKNQDPGVINENRLPVLIHSCPSNFSTVEYFETLETKHIGRLVLYCDVITSSQLVISKKLKHGFVVIPRQQTCSIGRSSNSWLSPLGSASFSLQMHIPLDSPLGRSIPLVQHLVMVAVVNAIKTLPGYEVLNIGIKWPNDLYVHSKTKIGGLIVTSVIEATTAIVNIGCGINLSNSVPTTCVNDIIQSYNEVHRTSLKHIAPEVYFGRVFNEIETIYNTVQAGNLTHFYDLYYKYWLHSNSEIVVNTTNGSTRKVCVLGIDEYGYLKVKSEDGSVSSVQPDGNTFDMIQGLIAPKIF